jgi:predicted aminopeptidase
MHVRVVKGYMPGYDMIMPSDGIKELEALIEEMEHDDAVTEHLDRARALRREARRKLGLTSSNDERHPLPPSRLRDG